MKVRVIGTRSVDFTDNETGSRICGTSIYVTYPDKGVEGERYNKVFVPSEKTNIIPKFDFGDIYDFVYECNGFGKSAKNVLSKIVKA